LRLLKTLTREAQRPSDEARHLRTRRPATGEPGPRRRSSVDARGATRQFAAGSAQGHSE
jgi:hypothetical protein